MATQQPVQHQYSLSLIQHKVNNSVILQREIDGYINATDLCHAAGKRFYNYRRTEETGNFLRVLEAKTQIRVLELIQEVTTAGVTATWVHPKVAIHLAQWVSPEFSVQVSEWVFDWFNAKETPKPPAKLPHHLERYLVNDGQVPPGYFSLLQESGLSLFGPLHMVGFDIPKGWVPDISIGQKFCEHLREKHGVDTDALETYRHDYLDGRVISGVKLYPEDLLPLFRRWFRQTWLPTYGVKYFKGKDPDSLAYLDKLPALMAPKTRLAIPPGAR